LESLSNPIALRMSQINPFTGAMPLSPSRSASEQLSRARSLSKNLPADEAAEHVIENPDAVVMISEDHTDQSPRKREEPKKHSHETDDAESPAHLDVTA
jgi:hypothetical protein